jgi:hypothetical protein
MLHMLKLHYDCFGLGKSIELAGWTCGDLGAFVGRFAAMGYHGNT